MLTKPIVPKGKWVMDDEGLKIYDGLGILVKEISDKEKALQIGSILFDGFSYGEGVQTQFESEELKAKMKAEWDFYNSHCSQCEKPLPKTRPHYIYQGMNLCTRCYNKKDTWINNIFLKVE